MMSIVEAVQNMAETGVKSTAAEKMTAAKSWTPVLVLCTVIGAYVDTHSTQNKQFATLINKMDDHAKISQLINQRITRHDWDLDRYADRVNGQAEKNLEQDTRIRQIELRLAATRSPSLPYDPGYPQTK
jgi:hypothetical protein